MRCKFNETKTHKEEKIKEIYYKKGILKLYHKIETLCCHLYLYSISTVKKKKKIKKMS